MTTQAVPHFVVNDLTTGVRHTIRLTPREGMTVAEALAFLADRRAAAQLVDPENCATTQRIVEAMDAYELFDVPDEWSLIGSELFVRSLPNGPWVWSGDLPDETYKRLLSQKADQ